MENVFNSSGKQASSTSEMLCNELVLLNPDFFNDGERFKNAAEQLTKDIAQFQRDIENIPIISLIILWGRAITIHDAYHAEKKIRHMIELLRSGFYIYKNNGVYCLLKEYPAHNLVINAIRCKMEWSIEKQEEIVKLYVEFSEWLSKNTYGYIFKAEDKDAELAIRRKLPFDRYVRLMSKLEARIDYL